jgi:hypothetical protein
MNSNHKLSQGDLEELLPWHAAGTLDATDAAEVERALAADPELARRFALVREELTETILLNVSLGVPSARTMEKLFRVFLGLRRRQKRHKGELDVRYRNDNDTPGRGRCLQSRRSRSGYGVR